MTAKKKVVITDHDYGSQKIEHGILDAIADVQLYQCKNVEDILSDIADVDGLLVEYAQVTRKVIESCKNLKVISRYGIGYDSVDVEAATDNGIVVCNVPDYCYDEVVIHTVALILSLVRKVVFLDKAVKTQAWDLSLQKPLYALGDMTLGLVAFGNIARGVAEKMRPFGVKIISSDPYAPDELFGRFGVEKVQFDELLERADIVSIHSALTKETFHLFGSEQFRKMKKSAVLINTSRGSLVDELALYEALAVGDISAAAIDVAEQEPIARDNPLLALDNIIITPHASFYSERSIIQLQQRAATAVLDVLSGRKPRNPVNPEVLSVLDLS